MLLCNVIHVEDDPLCSNALIEVLARIPDVVCQVDYTKHNIAQQKTT